MPRILTSALLSLGLVAGTALAAHAQSVSSLPPEGAASVPQQTAVTQPYGSTQSFFPKPGGSSFWKDTHYQAPPGSATNPNYHPYTASIGPQPGSFSSGKDVPYHPTAADAAPARHPYDATGMGPRTN
ncbi:MAG: hypothetical protein ACREE2_05415 [Stellaceae bacterium]